MSTVSKRNHDPRSGFRRSRSELAAVTAALVVVLGGSPSALAQGRSGADVRVVVLRETKGVATGVERAVDRAFVRSMADDAGFARLEISPIALDEIQLAAGCMERSRECLRRIARTLDADVLVVRELAMIDASKASIRITSFESGAAEEPPQIARVLDEGATAAPREVPRMVRALYRIPEPVRVDALDEPEDGGDRGGVSIVTWTLLASGAALLSAGVLLGIEADRVHDEYARIRISSEEDADRAASLLDTAEDEAIAANVLLATGGLAAGVGAGLLIHDLLRRDDSPDGARVSIAPVRGGGQLVVAGPLSSF